MVRNVPAILAFAAGFGLAVAAVHLTPASRQPGAQALVAEPAPWTQHRASVLLAQETAELRQLRDSGRMALAGLRDGGE